MVGLRLVLLNWYDLGCGFKLYCLVCLIWVWLTFVCLRLFVSVFNCKCGLLIVVIGLLMVVGTIIV